MPRHRPCVRDATCRSKGRRSAGERLRPRPPRWRDRAPSRARARCEPAGRQPQRGRTTSKTTLPHRRPAAARPPPRPRSPSARRRPRPRRALRRYHGRAARGRCPDATPRALRSRRRRSPRRRGTHAGRHRKDRPYARVRSRPVGATRRRSHLHAPRQSARKTRQAGSCRHRAPTRRGRGSRALL